MNALNRIAAAFLVSATTALAPLTALYADDFDDLVGFTVIARSHVSGEFNGADFGKSVRLDNGMVF